MAPTLIPAMGHDEKVALVAESSYGGGGTPVAWYRPAQMTMGDNPQISPLQGPTGVMVPYLYNASLPRHFADVPDRSGQLVVECDYDYIGHLLAAAVFSATSVDEGTAAYSTHTFTIPSTTPGNMMDSLFLQRRSTIDDWEWTGVMVNQLVLRGQPGQYVTATLDLVASGSDLTTSTFETPEVLATQPWIEFFHSDIGVDAGIVEPTGSDFLSGTGADVEEWTLTINNNLDISQVAGGGTFGIRAPTFSDYRTVTLEWTHRWDATYDFTGYMNPSSETGRYKWVQLLIDDGVDLGGTPSSNSVLKVDIPRAVFLGDMPVYDGGGGFLRQSCRVQAGGGGAAPLTITLVNDTLDASPTYGATAPA